MKLIEIARGYLKIIGAISRDKDTPEVNVILDDLAQYAPFQHLRDFISFSHSFRFLKSVALAVQQRLRPVLMCIWYTPSSRPSSLLCKNGYLADSFGCCYC